MVESLRKLVSGNRRRFVNQDFSLDLTYIIPNRIIAMSYPAHGFESLYRNKIDNVSAPIEISDHFFQVSEFLRRNHGDKFHIINTSERATYDSARYFGGRVTNYHWPDHHGPPFAFLYQIAKQGYDYLKGKSLGCNLTYLRCGSRPRERDHCALQLRQRPHRYSHLRPTALYGLLRQRGRLPKVLRAHALHLRQGCQPALLAALLVLLRGLLPQQDQVASRQTSTRHPVRSGAQLVEWGLRALFRSV